MEDNKMQENKVPERDPMEGEGAKTVPEVKSEPMGSSDNTGGASAGENQEDGDETLYGVLAYIGILFLIPFLAKKENDFCQFHAKQGMVLFFAEVVGSLTMWMFGLGVLINLVALVFSIMGIIAVLGKEKKPLPIVENIVKKLNL